MSRQPGKKVTLEVLSSSMTYCSWFSRFSVARPTLSQPWSSKIRHTMFLNNIQFADLLILRLYKCERFRRVYMVKLLNFTVLSLFYPFRRVMGLGFKTNISHFQGTKTYGRF